MCEGSYLDQEFVRIGYYVNNEYSEPFEPENPPSPIEIGKTFRNILAEQPRVTRFPIAWTGEVPVEQQLSDSTAGYSENDREAQEDEEGKASEAAEDDEDEEEDEEDEDDEEDDEEDEGDIEIDIEAEEDDEEGSEEGDGDGDCEVEDEEEASEGKEGVEEEGDGPDVVSEVVSSGRTEFVNEDSIDVHQMQMHMEGGWN